MAIEILCVVKQGFNTEKFKDRPLQGFAPGLQYYVPDDVLADNVSKVEVVALHPQHVGDVDAEAVFAKLRGLGQQPAPAPTPPPPSTDTATGDASSEGTDDQGDNG